jgi:hypothetical protein
MMERSEPASHWMSSQLRHRLQPSMMKVAKGFSVSFEPM